MKLTTKQAGALSSDFARVESPAFRQLPPPSHCSRPACSSALNLGARLVDDPAISYWLKKAIVSALDRDLVDAVNDAELLLSVLSARLEEIQGGAQ